MTTTSIQDDYFGSWEDWDPTGFWNSESTETQTVGKVDDDFGLFYRGKTNTVIAESEAGKSWLGLLVCAQEIKAGNNVRFIDFEDDGPEIYTRLEFLADRDVIKEYFHYSRPEETYRDGFAENRCAGMSAVIIDGLGEALTLHGLKQDDQGVLEFNSRIRRAIASTGAAEITLDHFPKNRENQENAYGSVYKKNSVSGAIYALRNKEPFGKGRKGSSVLEVFKDRPGNVRTECETDGSKFLAAELHIDAVTDKTKVRLKYATASRNDDDVYLQRVSDFMAARYSDSTITDKPMNKSDLKTSVKGDNAKINAAIEELIKLGNLAVEGRKIVFVKPYKPKF